MRCEMRSKEKMYLQILLVATVLLGGVSANTARLCSHTIRVDLSCNADTYQWVQLQSVVGEECGFGACGPAEAAAIESLLKRICVNVSSCHFAPSDVPSAANCAAKIDFECIQGAPTTQRVVNTTPPRAGDWVKNYGSWQWAIIWIIIAVVLVAFIILAIMLINKCCFKMLNNEKPKFMDGTPTHSNVGSTMNSRSVSMSTLSRPPIKKEVSQEEIDEIRTQFGTAKKNKDKNMKHFGVGIGSTLDSRRSSGDGASGEPNGKHYVGDDSSSGIGSVTYDSRIKHGLYDDADTCHDDYISYTMKKNAKSPLVNPQGYATLQNTKKVDEDLYKKEAPTVDICEDRREEDFRLDINSWTLNKHGQQVRRADPAGATTISAQIESAGSDIQLNPGSPEWTLHDHHKITTVKARQGHLKGYHRMGSIISIGSENLGFIPEDETLSIQPASADITHSDDNPHESTSTSSAKELVLDLSNLDISLSSDQFSFRQPSRTKNFYEAFGTPRSQSGHDSLKSTDSGVSHLQDVHSPLSSSFPNVALHSTPFVPESSTTLPASISSNLSVPTENIHRYTKRSSAPLNPAQLFSRSLPTAMRYDSEYDSWNNNRSYESMPTSKRISKIRSGNSRVNYLTQLKLGETVRLQQEKKKRKRFNPKGTIHYAFKSDVSLAES